MYSIIQLIVVHGFFIQFKIIIVMVLHTYQHQDIFINGRRNHYITHHLYINVTHFSYCGGNNYLEQKYNLPKLRFRIEGNISQEMWDKINEFGQYPTLHFIRDTGEIFCSSEFPEVKLSMDDYKLPVDKSLHLFFILNLT
jgi:hypothetical protein